MAVLPADGGRSTSSDDGVSNFMGVSSKRSRGGCFLLGILALLIIGICFFTWYFIPELKLLGLRLPDTKDAVLSRFGIDEAQCDSCGGISLASSTYVYRLGFGRFLCLVAVPTQSPDGSLVFTVPRAKIRYYSNQTSPSHP